MIYKFCDTDCLLYNYPKIIYHHKPNEKIVVCTQIFENFTGKTAHVLDNFEYHKIPYEFYKFEEYMLNRIVYDHNGKNIEILAAALDYDCTQHPDETVFVTTDPEMADIANLYFGEDSIICISQSLV